MRTSSSEGERAATHPLGRLHRAWEEAGARLESFHGRRAAVRFGGVDEEHLALVRAVGLVGGTDRGLVRVTGDHAVRMLNGLVTNDLRALAEGRAVYAFVLTPKGRPLAELRLLPAGKEIFLDAPAACLDPLLAHLGKYLPPIYARFEPWEAHGRLSLVGPRAEESLEAARAALDWARGLPLPARLEPLRVARRARGEEGEGKRPGDAGVAGGIHAGTPDLFLVRREEVEGPGFDLYVPTARLSDAWRQLEAVARELGGGPVGREAYEVWRVERGVPAYGADIDEGTLPQETGQEARAISYEKGCYTGQELVARIHYRGHVNRLLRGLAFGDGPGDAPPPRGQELYRDDRPAGLVTTPALSPRFGPIALGYVRREVEPGERLALEPRGEPSARVVALPFTST